MFRFFILFLLFKEGLTSDLTALNDIKDNLSVNFDSSNQLIVSLSTSSITTSVTSGVPGCVDLSLDSGSWNEMCSSPSPMANNADGSITFRANKYYDSNGCTSFRKGGSTGAGQLISNFKLSATNSFEYQFMTGGGSWCCCYYLYMRRGSDIFDTTTRDSSIGFFPQQRGSYSIAWSYAGSRVMAQNTYYCIKTTLTGNTMTKKMYQMECDSVTSSTAIFHQSTEEITDEQKETLGNGYLYASFGDCSRRENAYIKISKIRSCGTLPSVETYGTEVILSANEIDTPLGSFTSSSDSGNTVFMKTVSESDFSAFTKQSSNIASANIFVKISKNGNLVGTLQIPILFKLEENSISVLGISVSPSTLTLPITNLVVQSETSLTCSKNNDYTGSNTGYLIGDKVYCKITPSQSYINLVNINSVSLNGNELVITNDNSPSFNREERFWFVAENVGLDLLLNATSTMEFLSHSGRRILDFNSRRLTSSNYKLSIINY